MHQDQAGGVGPRGIEARMPEGQQARIPEQQVEPHGKHREDHHVHEQVDHEPGADGRQEKEPQDEEREENEPDLPFHGFVYSDPNSPWGRTSSTAARRINTKAISNTGKYMVPYA